MPDPVTPMPFCNAQFMSILRICMISFSRRQEKGKIGRG
jgi:hypothetical protein